VQALKELK
jgi:hypothetical protein